MPGVRALLASFCVPALLCLPTLMPILPATLNRPLLQSPRCTSPLSSLASTLVLVSLLSGCASSGEPPAPAAQPPAAAASAASAVAAAPASAAASGAQEPTEPVATPVANGSVTVSTLPVAVEPGSVPYAERADVQAWARDVAQRTELPIAWLQAAFAEARYQPNAAKYILPAPAGTPKNWTAYRARFIEPKRIKAGVAFWNENEGWLKQAQREYGVPPEIIVGLLGVETMYGRDMGRFRILDALVTLGFDFPANAPRDRSAYFRSELEQFYLLCRDIHANPLEINSSYAGAIGLPQFMPSSWRKYAVDFDGDGRIDLIRSPADAIGSVAHYLAEFGWVRDMPSYYSVHGLPDPGANLTRLLTPDIVPSFTADEMAQLGVLLSRQGQQHPSLLALVKLENGNDAPTYVAGTDNFYAITRYNQSSPYAMAVIDLGKAIAQARQTGG